LRKRAAGWRRLATISKQAVDASKTRPRYSQLLPSLAQQAAEKALKALLTFHQKDFEKTHNLDELGQQCVAVARSLAGIAQSGSAAHQVCG